VAAAGKDEYPLPHVFYVALRDPFHPGAPGSYASGGPTDNVPRYLEGLGAASI